MQRDNVHLQDFPPNRVILRLRPEADDQNSRAAPLQNPARFQVS